MATPPRPFPYPRVPHTPEAWGVPSVAGSDGLPAPRIWRSRSDRVIAGVIGGAAEKFGLEARPVRLLYGVLTAISAGMLLIPYLAVWAVTSAHGPAAPGPRFWRSRTRHVVAGVLGGLSEKLGAPALLIRTLYAGLTVVTGVVPGLLLYLVLWATTKPIDVPTPRGY